MKACNQKRRQLIQALGLGALAMSLPLPLMAQATGNLSTETLADGITLIRGAGANVVVVEGPESIVVIDGGLREHAEALLEEIRRLTNDKPITALFNTNWRPEHTGLNHLLGPEGVRIIAHENTRLWQTASFHVEWEGKDYHPLPEAAQANETFFYDGGSLSVGDETLEYDLLPQAHTDGDIYIRFRQANLVVVSDLLAVDAYPVMDWETGGWVGGLQNASRALLEMADSDTRFVPAEGSAQPPAALEAQADMLDKARNEVAEAYRNGKSLQEFIDSDPLQRIGVRHDGAEAFLKQLYQGAWGHVRELGRIV